MFAGGLDMFGGGSEDDDATEEDQQEVEDANAGIEITLMDTQLRPYVFFTSKSELMGHVWSGTASERTTALQVRHDTHQILLISLVVKNPE
jgi:microsomal triglyceride transfer protein large subunit